jgi:hypothetical protein
MNLKFKEEGNSVLGKVVDDVHCMNLCIKRQFYFIPVLKLLYTRDKSFSEWTSGCV